MKLLIKNINSFSNSEYKNIYQLIKKEKATKIDKIQSKKSKKASILGEYLFIIGLKRFYNIEYINIDINYNENGKPYINNYPIFFNISHSGNYVIIVFSNKEIGIDIQKKEKTLKSLKNYITTTNDKKILNHILHYDTIAIFSLKESYIKMLGKRINDIKKIEISNILKNNIIVIDDNKYYTIVICEKKTR